jgi:hypothetical protein
MKYGEHGGQPWGHLGTSFHHQETVRSGTEVNRKFLYKSQLCTLMSCFIPNNHSGFFTTDGHALTHKQKEQSKYKGFRNNWKCTIFSQLSSDLFHISSFPPCDDLYCVAVVKFQLYCFSENLRKSYSACVQREHLQIYFLPFKNP